MHRARDIFARASAPFRRARRGAAMTETALLCFFLYVPVLMMIIIWGDMSLDKERAHVASSYMAFRTDPLTTEELVDEFFPTATGQTDATMSARRVRVEADESSEGPEYELPSSTAGDYSGEDPEFDLQYKLYSLAVGEVHVTYELQALPDGTMGFMARWQQIEDDVARYLAENEIVEVGEIQEDAQYTPVGDEIQLSTGVSSTAYTHYVELLTDLFNGEWDAGGAAAGGTMGNTMPRLESQAGLGTRFQSPFLWELEREVTVGRPEEAEYVDGPFPRVGGQPGFEMHFGATDQVPEDDDSFHSGYTYLRNPDYEIDADALRNDLYELSPSTFSYQPDDPPGSEEVHLHEMPDPHSSQEGETHTQFLRPGNPLEAEE